MAEKLDRINSIKELMERLDMQEEELLYPTDLKHCIIGIVERFGMSPVILLDKNKCLETFMNRDGMTYEDAVEHFNFNTIGSWVGEGTPAFAEIIKRT